MQFQLHSRAKPIYLLVLLCMQIAACTSFPDRHADPAKNTPAVYREDLKDCTLSYPETPDGVYLKQRISCMKLKGWK